MFDFRHPELGDLQSRLCSLASMIQPEALKILGCDTKEMEEGSGEREEQLLEDSGKF